MGAGKDMSAFLVPEGERFLLIIEASSVHFGTLFAEVFKFCI